jgi:hypothetical protein
MRRRSQTLPAMPTSKDATTGGSSSNADPVDDQPNKSTGEKFKGGFQLLNYNGAQKSHDLLKIQDL